MARSRAVLACRRGSLAGGPAAVLAVGGSRPVLLVRGIPGAVAPVWTPAAAFTGSVRAVGADSGPAGRLLSIGGEMGSLVCGLCGGLPAWAVDEWIADHPLSEGLCGTA